MRRAERPNAPIRECAYLLGQLFIGAKRLFGDTKKGAFRLPLCHPPTLSRAHSTFRSTHGLELFVLFGLLIPDLKGFTIGHATINGRNDVVPVAGPTDYIVSPREVEVLSVLIAVVAVVVVAPRVNGRIDVGAATLTGRADLHLERQNEGDFFALFVLLHEGEGHALEVAARVELALVASVDRANVTMRIVLVPVESHVSLRLSVGFFRHLSYTIGEIVF
jgi:hypothetical protein